MFEEVQISAPEEGKAPKKGRELPQKQTWGGVAAADNKRGGAASNNNAGGSS